MTTLAEQERVRGLPPLVGLKVLVVSLSLERAHDRARRLEEFGYRVHACGDPGRLRAAIRESAPGAVVLDLGSEVGFPGEAVTRAREETTAPIIAVGCTGAYSEMLRCFEAGADDYCAPRCQTDEVDVRLRAIFRRLQASSGLERRAAPPPVLRIGELEIDQASQVVRKNGHVVALSPTEFRLLVTLAEHAGEVIPSKALIARVWGNQYSGETHYLRLYVRYLRQKLEDDPSNPRYIVNRWGTGYALGMASRAVA